MWWMQREDLKTKIRDLEAVRGILMNLRMMNVVRDDKELDNWMHPVEEQVLARIVKLRAKVNPASHKYFWSLWGSV